MTKTYYINDGEYGPKITPTSAWNDEIQKRDQFGLMELDENNELM